MEGGDGLTVRELHNRYAAGVTPSEVCDRLYDAIQESKGVFITVPSRLEVQERCRYCYCMSEICVLGLGLPKLRILVGNV